MQFRDQQLEADGHSLETTLAVLADDRRRTLLRLLDRRGAPVSLAELSKALAKRDADLRPVGDGAAAAVDVELHHVHLPKLADAGVLEYEPAARVVTAADTAAIVEFLDSIDDSQ